MERRISCSADAGAEHEKALIAPIQLSALKRNVTHAAREVEAIQKHSVRRSFTSGLASVKLLLALEPVSHSVLEGRPEFCFLVEKGEGEKRWCSSKTAPSCEECATWLYRMLLKYLWFQEATLPNYPCKNECCVLPEWNIENVGQSRCLFENKE